MVKYPVEAPDPLWDLFSDSVPRAMKKNDILLQLIKEHLAEEYSEQDIKDAVQFDEAHLEYYREEIVRGGDE
jgi:predicted restriction endonuclease